MKKVILFLLLLCPFLSIAQGTQTIVMVPGTGYAGTPYLVKTIRNKADYPLTDDGLARLKAAVVGGLQNLTVISSGTYASDKYTPTVFYADGCIIAKNTVPGPSAPNCTTVTPPPTTTAVAAYSKMIQAENATSGTGGTFTYAGDTFRGPVGNSSQYVSFTFDDAPIAASNYTFSIRYQTNFDSGSGTMKLIINGASQDVPTEAASGGQRIYTVTNQTLSLGTNTIRIEGSSQDHYIDYISINRAASN